MVWYLVPLLLAALRAEEPKAPEIRPRAPQLSAVFPQGSEPGKTVEVEILGQSLDRSSAVIFLDPSIKGRVLRESHGSLALSFEIAKEASFGPHYFRVVSPRGASNLLLFRIGDLPHVLETEPNTSMDEAQKVPVPVTIQGRLPVDQDADFFRFHASKGQTLVFDLRAARNGSSLDAALILLDSQSRKLEHDEDHFVWDPFFSHTFAADGDYTAIIQPTHTHNDPGFGYQLDIRTSPHVESLNPIAMVPGSKVEATLYGAGFTQPNLPLWFDSPGFTGRITEVRGDSARAEIAVPATAKPGFHTFAVTTPQGRSNNAQFVIDDTPPHRGGDAIQLPVSITGIARYRQPERFKFQAEEGQKLLFEVRAMRLGATVDATLRILDESGKQIAFNDDGAFPGVQFNKDPQLLHTFTKSGSYTLEIRNLWKIAGESHPYQLLVRPPQPAVEAMLAADALSVQRNGTATLKLTAVRKEGFAKAIPVTVEGLPEGVKASAAEIPAGKNETEITFHAGDLPVGSYAQIRVIAAGEPAWRSAKISSGGGEGAAYGTSHATTLVIAEPARYSLEAAATSVNLVRGAGAEVKVNIKRAAGFIEPIRFSFEKLPDGVSAGAAVSAEGATEATVTLRASPDAAIGRQRVIILGLSPSGESQEAAKISLVVD